MGISGYICKTAARLRGHRHYITAPVTWTGKTDRNILMQDCPFVVFDTELSGLDPKKDFIISIGAVKMTGAVIHINQEFNRLVQPAGELARKNVEIHEIVPGDLKDAQPIEEVLREFYGFIEDSVLVGHFANIDMGFLNAASRKIYGEKVMNPAIDTHSIHQWLSENSSTFKKHYRGGSPKTDLFSVARAYGIEVDDLHDALSDAFITAQLLQRFTYFMHAESMHTLSELQDIGRA
ncbi:MAG: 3'-5' exonuclease [Nitrospira sp.]|nr:3'-5' exonuclease [bacterium]MBL7048171.1 3'-5' exonuclease [Nitrospira sp.]